MYCAVIDFIARKIMNRLLVRVYGGSTVREICLSSEPRDRCLLFCPFLAMPICAHSGSYPQHFSKQAWAYMGLPPTKVTTLTKYHYITTRNLT